MGCEALIWDALPSKESGCDCGASPTVSSTIGYPGSRKFETQAENRLPPKFNGLSQFSPLKFLFEGVPHFSDRPT